MLAEAIVHTTDILLESLPLTLFSMPYTHIPMHPRTHVSTSVYASPPHMQRAEALARALLVAQFMSQGAPALTSSHLTSPPTRALLALLALVSEGQVPYNTTHHSAALHYHW